MSPIAFAPIPDGAGTAAFELPAGVRSARIAHPDLRALDLTTTPELETLDLRGCADDFRLALQSYGALRRIVLPAGGAVVFLERHALGPLTLQGPVRTLDVTWTNADGAPRAVELCAARHEALSGVHLGALDEPPPTTAEAWVLVGGTLDRNALLDCKTPRLWLVDVQAPDGLELRHPLDSLRLHHVATPRLRFQYARKVRMRPCGALASVDGHAGHLVLRGGDRIDELAIEGLIGEADLYDMQCRSLRALGCDRLRLGRAEHIASVHVLGAGVPVSVHCDGVGPEVRGAARHTVRVCTPREIEHQFFEGAEAGRIAMLAWAQSCGRPVDLENALRVFCSAIDSDFTSSTAAWQARCELYQRQGPRGRPKEGWNWPFPEDQALSGFATDLRLWLRHLMDAPAEARDAAAVFTQTGAPSNVAALLYVAAARDLDPEERDQLLDLARRACEQGAALGHRLDLADRHANRPVGLSREAVSFIDTALACLLANAAHPEAPRIAAAFSDWLVARAPTEDGVRVLGKLHAHGCVEAARAIQSVRRGLPHRRELDGEARERLLLAITRQHLLPPEQPRFAA